MDTIIASGAGVGAFLPKRITALYGKEYEVRVSVSPISMRKTQISYQVDRIIGVINTAPVEVALAQHRMSFWFYHPKLYEQYLLIIP